MSLKAKLEAVIYAAEEPVTLAQLASLFAQDAFRWKAEREETQRKLMLSVASAIEADSEVDDGPGEDLGEEPGMADSTRELADLREVVEPAEAHTAEAAEREAAAEFVSPDAEMVNEPASPAATQKEAELEAKRLQRLREREVHEILREALDELIAEYAGEGRGLEIREIAGGFRMGTKPEIHDAVRAFVKSLKPPLKLSLPALETLAVIAYKQPVTAPEVGEVRGVDSAGVLGSLLSRKLIATAGRKQVIGRPILYKTTREFLLRFGLKDLNELPSMEEFEKMAALELSEESDEETAEPAEQSGDLFTSAESDDARSSEEDEPAASTGAADQQASEPQASEEEVVTEVSTPTAEPSKEAAEAHALVERQNAEEVEVER
jgi:segregation and condensation protein B